MKKCRRRSTCLCGLQLQIKEQKRDGRENLENEKSERVRSSVTKKERLGSEGATAFKKFCSLKFYIGKQIYTILFLLNLNIQNRALFTKINLMLVF